MTFHFNIYLSGFPPNVVAITLGYHIDYLPDGTCRFSQPARISELYFAHKEEIDQFRSPTIPMSSAFSDADQDNSPP